MRKRKLNSGGFTLSELLVVVLILSIVMIVVVGGVTVVKNSYTSIKLRAESDTLMSTAIADVMDEMRYAGEIKTEAQTYTDSSGSAKTENVTTFLSGTRGYRIFFFNDSGSKGIMLSAADVTKSQNAPLLTGKSMPDGLIPSISYTYDETSGLFTATITISHNGSEFAKQTITARPLN
jgi:prepilin-type N-terminal cleavage/methylation domain